MKNNLTVFLQSLNLSWSDLWLGLLLMSFAAFSSYWSSLQIHPFVYEYPQTDIWFDADLPRYYEMMTIRDKLHSCTAVKVPFTNTDLFLYAEMKHPLLAIFIYTPVQALRTLGFEALTAVRIFNATGAAIWCGLLFLLLRLMKLRRLEATLLTVLGLVSAAVIFGLSIPESRAWGSISILTMLIIVALTERRPVSQGWYLGGAIFTACFALSNSMFGFLAIFLTQSRKIMARIIPLGIALWLCIWLLEFWVMNGTPFPLLDPARCVPPIGPPERLNLTEPREGTFTSFFFHTMVMPEIKPVVSQPYKIYELTVMTTQHSNPGSGTTWGLIATVIWAGLLGLGSWVLFRLTELKKFRWYLGIAIILQVAGQAFYFSGKNSFLNHETFAFAMHFIPLLIPLVGLGLLTRWRKVAWVMIVALIITVTINNVMLFNQAIEFVQRAALN